MEDCGISDRDFYWFNSNAQTTVDAMMEAEVSADVDAVTSAIVAGVVDAEVAKRISDGQLGDEPRGGQDNTASLQPDPPTNILNHSPAAAAAADDDKCKAEEEEEEDPEALVAVARVVEETCKQIALQNELQNASKSFPTSETNTQPAADCVPMDVDQPSKQPAEQQPKQPNAQQSGHSKQQNVSNSQPISETQTSAASLAVVAVVPALNQAADEQTSKADKSAELDDDTEYVVENILDKKSDSNGLAKFLVKWENYPSDANSWEPVENLVDCEKVMTKYELKRAERLAKIYGSAGGERAPKGAGAPGTAGGAREKHKVYKVVDIMGLTLVKGEKYFLVSLADDMGSTFIRATLAHRLFPSKVIDFYMRHIKWKSSATKS